MAETIADMLTGGHPNSLGRTVEVVDLVLADPPRFAELFGCYESDDAVVRLRTSSAMKRVESESPELLVPYIDRLIEDVGALDQASAQWTLAQLFDRLSERLNDAQRAGALATMKRNLADHQDWIVLNTTMDTLATWARDEPTLRTWLRPHLERLTSDRRRSVASRATRHLGMLETG